MNSVKHVPEVLDHGGFNDGYYGKKYNTILLSYDVIN